MLKSGEITMIQGLNTNIALSLSSIWLPSFIFVCLCFFIDTSKAVAEEYSSLFNEDNPENCCNSGSPCGSVEDIWDKRLMSDSQLSLLSSSSSTATFLNFLFDFFFCILRSVRWMNLRSHFPLLNYLRNHGHYHHSIWLLLSLKFDLNHYYNWM